MKKILMLTLLLFGIATIACAQRYGNATTTDVIYTTDGLILQGTIIEQVPGVTYTIRTLEGSIHKIDALSIKRITKEEVAPYVVTENHNYYYDPYAMCRFDAEGNPIYPLSVTTAFTYSLLIPGLGQMYNGQALKGSLLFTGVLAGVFGLTVGTNMVSNRYADLVGYTSVVLCIGSYLYSLLDAPIMAARWNKKYGFTGRDYYMGVAPSVGIVGNGADADAAVGMSISLNF